MIDKNLKYLMDTAGISSGKLAKTLGVKPTIIRRLLSGENTNPTLSTLKLFADYFQVTVGQFIGEIDVFPQVLHEQVNVPYPSTTIENNGNIGVDLSKYNDIFAIVAPDNSMAPAIRKGSTVIVDPKIQPSNKDFVLVQENKEFFIRLLIKTEENSILVSSIQCFDMTCSTLSKNQLIGTVIKIIYSREQHTNMCTIIER